MFFIKGIIVVVFSVITLFPLFNDCTNFLPEQAPRGERLPKTNIHASIQNLISGTFQSSMSDRAKKRSGYWLTLIEAGNEIYLRLFFQTSAFPSDFPFNLTKDKYIFKMEHLPYFNRTQNINLKELDNKVKNLKKFQSIVKENGKTSIFVITPNLISLYPEIVPWQFRDQSRLTRQDPYEILTKLLDQYEVDYVDTQKLLLEKKSEYPFKFFAPTASHWNDVASCLALKAVNEKLWQLGNGVRRFSCNKWQYRKIPKIKDQDLSGGLNIYNRKRFFKETPYVEIAYEQEKLTSKPTVLTVGTSYLAAFMEHFVTWHLTQEATMYFYYRRQKVNGWRNFTNLKKENINWDHIFNTDIIILNAGISELNKFGYGFISETLKKHEKLHK